MNVVMLDSSKELQWVSRDMRVVSVARAGEQEENLDTVLQAEVPMGPILHKKDTWAGLA